MAGWVYIISNKAMPGILKIGYTERTPYIRAYELYNTGCPYPYKVDYSIYVNKPYEVEQKTHELQHSTNVGKEWFSCSQEQAIEAISNAIEICEAVVEKRDPPKPTPSELNDVIKVNPDVSYVIKRDSINKPKPRYNSYLSIKQGEVILQFYRVSDKKIYEDGLGEIYSEYLSKVNEYRDEYADVVNGNKKTDIVETLGNLLFLLVVPYMSFLMLISAMLGLSRRALQSHWGCVLLGYFILAIILSLYFRHKENEKQKRFKSSRFEDVYSQKIEDLNKKKEKKVSIMMHNLSNDFKIIKLD